MVNSSLLLKMKEPHFQLFGESYCLENTSNIYIKLTMRCAAIIAMPPNISCWASSGSDQKLFWYSKKNNSETGTA